MTDDQIIGLANEYFDVMPDETDLLRFVKAVTLRENARVSSQIVDQCIKTLDFHGFSEAVPYFNWSVKNKLGI